MNIFPRRRRSARVNNNSRAAKSTSPKRHQPGTPSHAPSRMCHGVNCPIFRSARGSATSKSKPHGGGLRQTYRHILPTSAIKNKRRKLQRHIKRPPRVLSSRRTRSTTARPPRCYPRTNAHQLLAPVTSNAKKPAPKRPVPRSKGGRQLEPGCQSQKGQCQDARENPLTNRHVYRYFFSREADGG